MNEIGQKQNHLFPQTRWSLVLRTRNGADGDAVLALGELLQSYWQPLYVFARKSGLTEENAKDAVQDFCSDLIRLESLRGADESAGRLRSFLLGGFQNHLRSLHRDATRQKRGGREEILSLDNAENALNMHPVDAETPARAFDRRWAYTLLERVLERLRQEYHERGRGELFALLEPTLVWNNTEMSYQALAEKLGTSTANIAQSVKRLRARYRHILEQELGHTVDGENALAEERAYFINILSDNWVS